MQPSTTDRRRRLMIVRAFVEEFLDLVDPATMEWRRSDEPIISRDQLERFLDLLSRRADEDDELMSLGGFPPETEVQVKNALNKSLMLLLGYSAQLPDPAWPVWPVWPS